MNVEKIPPTQYGKFEFVTHLSRRLLPHEHNQSHLIMVLAPQFGPLASPLIGCDVIVGFGSGDPLHVPISNYEWMYGRRHVLIGRHYKSGWSPIIHTTGRDGGEDIWVHAGGYYNLSTGQMFDIENNYYSSDIVKDADTDAPHTGTYTGWLIVFQLVLATTQ